MPLGPNPALADKLMQHLTAPLRLAQPLGQWQRFRRDGRLVWIYPEAPG